MTVGARSTPPEPGLVDAVSLVATYADGLVVRTARDTHGAVARRVFRVTHRGTGPASRLVQVVHDAVAGVAYGSVSAAFRGVAAGSRHAARHAAGPRLDASPAGRALHAAVNGLVGDRLREQYPDLALALTVRVDGRAVPPEPEALRRAFPDAGDRVVVFVHGLGEHEGHWAFKARERGGTYGSRLATVGGWTPVYLRVNTGLPVAENGVALTSLLQQLVDSWPVPVRRVALVGHSMGGLVIRAGCAVDTGRGDPWTDLVSDVVTLGTPHLGADLAAGVGHGARLLALAPELAAFGRLLDHRSTGIRDLERGLPELPPLPHVRYRLVSASVGSPRSLVGRLLGDLLVRRGSATATRRALRLFPEADLLHLSEADHLALLNHPQVDRALRQWLA